MYIKYNIILQKFHIQKNLSIKTVYMIVHFRNKKLFIIQAVNFSED